MNKEKPHSRDRVWFFYFLKHSYIFIKEVFDLFIEAGDARDRFISNEKQFSVAYDFDARGLEDGTGQINIDKYELNITSLPAGMNAQQLFEDIRLNFSSLVAGGNSILDKTRFASYESIDNSLWVSTDPTGTAMIFRTPLDVATVVVTEYSLDEVFWTFITVTRFNHWGHPVSGHRQFRLRDNGMEVLHL